MKISFSACALAALPLLVSNNAAAQTGDLWEISSQMNIPGMPAGMGAQTQRVCQGDDPERAAAQSKDRQNCKIKDKKQTATRLTVTMVCKDGTMTIDQQYNAAHTEFKGTMKMASKDGDMVINTAGRKVGACNVQEARRERDEKMAGAKKQVEAGQAQSAAMMKQMSDDQIKRCTVALDTMQYQGFGIHGQCYRKAGDKTCDAHMESSRTMQPEATKTCGSRVAEYCKRYQTQEGFLKAAANETGAQMCGVTTASIKAAQCPRAAQSQSLAFLGAYCPVEAKPIAQEHCTGRDYTSKMGGKYARFCQNYLANADFEKSGQSGGNASPADQVKQGVSKGMDKLKGLFGR
jgi:hypothetical protein